MTAAVAIACAYPRDPRPRPGVVTNELRLSELDEDAGV
jgi:hypothetical protein